AVDLLPRVVDVVQLDHPALAGRERGRARDGEQRREQRELELHGMPPVMTPVIRGPACSRAGWKATCYRFVHAPKPMNPNPSPEMTRLSAPSSPIVADHARPFSTPCRLTRVRRPVIALISVDASLPSGRVPLIVLWSRSTFQKRGTFASSWRMRV